MSAAIGLREDFDAKALRALAKHAKDGPQARRLLALAAIYDGAPRSEAAKIGGVTRQIVRDWVLRFNALGPEGLVDRKASGQPSLLNDKQRAALVQLVEEGRKGKFVWPPIVEGAQQLTAAQLALLIEGID